MTKIEPIYKPVVQDIETVGLTTLVSLTFVVSGFRVIVEDKKDEK